MAMSGNSNARKVGLYAKAPTRRIVELLAMPGEVDGVQLAGWARDLADAALTISEALAGELSEAGMEETRRQVVLYAEVGHEMHQLAGEIEGATGIRAASLGGLADDKYQELIVSQGRALELVLAQCKTAAAYVMTRIELHEEDGRVVARFSDKPDMGLTGRVRATLDYLAGHIRASKRIMKQFAANRAWRDRGADGPADLAERIKREIPGGAF